jgi:hypothetical protein
MGFARLIGNAWHAIIPQLHHSSWSPHRRHWLLRHHFNLPATQHSRDGPRMNTSIVTTMYAYRPAHKPVRLLAHLHVPLRLILYVNEATGSHSHDARPEVWSTAGRAQKKWQVMMTLE